MQQSRLPCSPLSPRVCSNSCPLNQWCHPTISSSVIPFSFCPRSFPASGYFPLSRFFVLGGKSIGASASASDLPVSIQSWFPLRLTGLISLLSEESMLSKQLWYIQPIEYGRNNDTSLLRLSCESHCGFCLSPSVCVCVFTQFFLSLSCYLLEEKPAVTTWAVQRTSPFVKELRPYEWVTLEADTSSPSQDDYSPSWHLATTSGETLS